MRRAAIVGLAWFGFASAVGCSAADSPGGKQGGTGGTKSTGTTGSGGSTFTTGTTGSSGSTSTTGTTGMGGTGGTAGGGSGGSVIGGGGSGGIPPKGGADGGLFVGVYTEPVEEAEDPPPAIAGGTMAIVGQGHRAAVSDPDNDQVDVVDLDKMTIVSTTPLLHGDEPGRIAEDGNGLLHVALRGGRAVAVIDPTAGAVLGRLPVCVHPRGLAYDANTGAMHVACLGGELVSYAAATGAGLRKVGLPRDLRDVVVDGDRLLVSRFRSAQVLVVESNGTISATLRPPPPTPAPSPASVAAVAWRMVPSPDGGALMVYQRLNNSSVQIRPGGYGGTCGGIVTTSVSLMRVDGSGFTVDNIPAVLPVDLATNSTREFTAISAAWTPRAINTSLRPFFSLLPPQPASPHVRISLAACSIPPPSPPVVDLAGDTVGNAVDPAGRVVAVGYGPLNKVVLQTREPATVFMDGLAVPLPGRSRKHTGHELFHLATTGGIACASCHPEGREDGQVWNFVGIGERRTQSVAGGISGTEPFHWNGDMTTFAALAHDVFNSRMSGPSITDEHVASLFRWIDKIPLLESPAPDDAAGVDRGRALFNDPSIGCASCHTGEKMTNNATVNVQTGGTFQVPSLRGLAWRAPYLHQGCAPTLDDRFGSCGGGDAHGVTSQLTADQRADLVKYLDTL